MCSTDAWSIVPSLSMTLIINLTSLNYVKRLHIGLYWVNKSFIFLRQPLDDLSHWIVELSFSSSHYLLVFYLRYLRKCPLCRFMTLLRWSLFNVHVYLQGWTWLGIKKRTTQKPYWGMYSTSGGSRLIGIRVVWELKINHLYIVKGQDISNP